MIRDDIDTTRPLAATSITDADLAGILHDLLLALGAAGESLAALGQPEPPYVMTLTIPTRAELVDAIAEAHFALDCLDHRVFSRYAELRRREPDEDSLARNTALALGQQYLTAFYGASEVAA